MKNYSGNTPIIKINYRYNNEIKSIYAKLEYFNPTGSIKDRIASYIIDKAIDSGQLKENQPIVETSSGNTGIAISAYGALLNHPVHIFMPDWVSEERIKLIKMYGANVHLVSKEECGFIGCLNKADELIKELDAFKFNQFSNIENIMAHYNTTGIEILNSVPNVTDFVSGVGSGGTIMGIGKRLKENRNTNLIAIEPDCSMTLSGIKPTRQHKIEGISDDFVPDIYNQKIIKEIIQINDDDAIAMARKLASELGLGVGISSGANFLGAVLTNKTNNQNVVTVFADDNKKYLSTSLANEVIKNDRMVSEKIELLNYEIQ